MIIELLYVGFGGFFGALLRYFFTSIIKENQKSSFPVGTLVVNILACFLLGLLSTIFNLPADLEVFLITGFLGSLSTFSTFILDVRKLGRKEIFSSIIYLSLSVGLGLLSFKISTLIYN